MFEQAPTEDESVRPTDRILRSRRLRATALRMDAALARLDLMTPEAHRRSPLLAVAVRALGLAIPDELTDREQRLLHLASEASELATQAAAGASFKDHALAYVALACCSWASHRTVPAPIRTAALAAASALAPFVSENVRDLMGLSAELHALAGVEAIDRTTREAAILGLSSPEARGAIAADLGAVVARVEAELLEGRTD